MRRYVLVLCVAAAFGGGPGSAAAKEAVAAHCEPEVRTHCVEVIRSAGRIDLTFRIFASVVAPSERSYRLCVHPVNEPPPVEWECPKFRLWKESDGVFASRIDFRRNFPHEQSGRYVARWYALPETGGVDVWTWGALRFAVRQPPRRLRFRRQQPGWSSFRGKAEAGEQ